MYSDKNLDEIKTPGVCAVINTCPNFPDPDENAWGSLEVTDTGTGTFVHRLSTQSYGQSHNLYDRIYNSQHWLEWQRIATATPPQIFNLPLVDGFSNFENVTSAYWKNQFGEATVILQAEKEQPINDGEIAAYLPAGFRPSAPQRFLCLGPTLRRPGFLYVDPDGSIKISFGGNAPCTDVLASFTFVAAT